MDIPYGVMDIMSEETSWFVLKDGKELGPFGFYEVIRMVQQNKVHSMDYIRRGHEKKWQQVADLSDFQLHNFKSMDEPQIDFGAEIYNRRRFERYEINEKAFFNHNEASVWSNALELSFGGLAIECIYGLLDVGSSIKIHLRIGQESINAVGKVISKRDWKNPTDNSFSFRYGVKFMKLDPKSKVKLSKIIADFESKNNKKVAA